MDYYLNTDDVGVLEARVTIEGGCVVLHSRSGRPRGAADGNRGRNPDYVAAFDTIFERLALVSGAITQVLLDSSVAHKVPEDQRVLAVGEDFMGSLDETKMQIRTRMRAFGRAAHLPANEGNQNKKIRIDTKLSEVDLVNLLQASVPAPNSAVKLLAASELRKVGPQHILKALTRLDAEDSAVNFYPSQDYDVMTSDGKKYSPMHVFGFALEAALGIDAGPSHFQAGWGTPCFDILEGYGLWITSKTGKKKRPAPTYIEPQNGKSKLIPTDEERTWIEGNPKIVFHLSKERQPGLAAKKRAQFIKDHGKLLCERCKLNPIEAYGEEAGAACIEVHHHRTHVAVMAAEHETSLDDLKCLCANCHRVLHRALTLGLRFSMELPKT